MYSNNTRAYTFNTYTPRHTRGFNKRAEHVFLKHKMQRNLCTITLQINIVPTLSRGRVSSVWNVHLVNTNANFVFFYLKFLVRKNSIVIFFRKSFNSIDRYMDWWKWWVAESGESFIHRILFDLEFGLVELSLWSNQYSLLSHNFHFMSISQNHNFEILCLDFV